MTKSGDWCPSLAGLDFERIRDENVVRLEEAFSEEEVFSALSELNGNKALGPNEFTITFRQLSWEFVEEVMGLFREFHEWGKFVRSLNITFLVLIQKKGRRRW